MRAGWEEGGVVLMSLESKLEMQKLAGMFDINMRYALQNKTKHKIAKNKF